MCESMARRACKFRQSDLSRALRAARSAGVKIKKIEIEPSGTIVMVPFDDDNRDQVKNEVESWLEKHAHQR
jgi:hypothetical protein